MNKVLKVMLAGLFVLPCLTLTACGEKDPPHTHSFSGAWSSDMYNHYHNCSGCTETSEVGAHASSSEWLTDEYEHYRLCDTCGYKFEQTAHTAQEQQKNATHHWYTCVDCGVEYDKSEHTDANMDDYCDNCMYQVRETSTLTFLDGYNLNKIYDGNPVVAPTSANYQTNNTEGNVTIEWYKFENSLNAYVKVSKAPKNVGLYKLKVSIARTNTHTAVVEFKEFSIEKAPVTISAVTNFDCVYTGGTAVVPDRDDFNIPAGHDGELTYEYLYENSRMVDAPVDAGSYILTVKLSEGSNYCSATSDPIQFTVSKAPGSVTFKPEVNLSKTFDEQCITPIDVNTDCVIVGDGVRIVNYYEVGNSSPVDSDIMNAGEYYVVVSVINSTNHLDAESDPLYFTISKADIPDTAISNLDVFKNDFYVGQDIPTPINSLVHGWGTIDRSCYKYNATTSQWDDISFTYTEEMQNAGKYKFVVAYKDRADASYNPRTFEIEFNIVEPTVIDTSSNNINFVKGSSFFSFTPSEDALYTVDSANVVVYNRSDKGIITALEVNDTHSTYCLTSGVEYVIKVISDEAKVSSKPVKKVNTQMIGYEDTLEGNNPTVSVATVDEETDWVMIRIEVVMDDSYQLTEMDNILAVKTLDGTDVTVGTAFDAVGETKVYTLLVHKGAETDFGILYFNVN